MNWIKTKIKKAWKWVVGLFVVGTTVLTISGFPPVLQGCELVASKVVELGSVNKVVDQKGKIEGLKNLKRGTIQGCAIADKVKHVARTNVEFSGADYDIQVVSTNPIEGGVEVFAKAWTGNSPSISSTILGQQIIDAGLEQQFIELWNTPKNHNKINEVKKGEYYELVQGTSNELASFLVEERTIPPNTQIGFGDGTVEIERFRIFNPPIMVDDPNGTVVRTSEVPYFEVVNGEKVWHTQTQTRKLREDPKTAILQTLAHNVKVTTGNIPRGRITPGKVGNTTSTFYPDANPETTTVDGRAGDYGEPGSAWATIRAAAGNGSADSENPIAGAVWLLDNNPSNWDRLARGIFGFDTSTIDDADTITSATISFVIPNANFADGHAQSFAIDHRDAPASPTAVANGDYDIGAWDDVDQATAIDITSLTHDGATYNDFALNATGIGNISKTVASWFGTRISGDIDNSEPTHGGGAAETRVDVTSADNAGTSIDPKLVVVHAGAAGGGVVDSIWDDNF